jgi:hypothetical protein
MSESASALLVYGIDIGDPDGYGTLGPMRKDEYDIEEIDVDWFDPDDDDREEGFWEALTRTLAERSGWDKTTGDPEDYVKEHLGVHLVLWGHYDHERYILAPVDELFNLSSGGGWDLRVVTAGELVMPPLGEADEKLMRALDLLGLTTTRGPAWLLAPGYG